MNAIELIDAVRACGAEIGVQDDRLVVSGELPNHLRLAIDQHRRELLAAFGIPFDDVTRAAIAELRPHLPPSLRDVPDEKLLTLVNWTLMAAFEGAIRHASR